LALCWRGCCWAFGSQRIGSSSSAELARIDEALEARVSALQDDLRLTRPPDDHGGPFSGGDNFEGGPRRKGRGPDGHDGPGGRDGFRRGERSGSGEILTVLSARTAALFNEADRSGYYDGMWGRNGSAPQVSANGPKGLAYPAELAPEVGRFFNRTRAGFREAIYLTERGHCALVDLAGDDAGGGAAVWLAAGGGRRRGARGGSGGRVGPHDAGARTREGHRGDSDAHRGGQPRGTDRAAIGGERVERIGGGVERDLRRGARCGVCRAAEFYVGRVA